jgi:pimeloyl-ACP methyl ester carboxylesterase
VIETLQRRLSRPGGIDVAWDMWGTGEVPLVLAHGFSGSAHDFALQIEPLAATRRVATLDHRGHGLSSKPTEPEDYALDMMVDDLVALIQSEIGAPVDLLGHSLGGRISLELALARSDLLRSLVLMDTTAEPFAPADEEMAALVLAFFESLEEGQMAEVAVPGLSDFRRRFRVAGRPTRRGRVSRDRDCRVRGRALCGARPTVGRSPAPRAVDRDRRCPSLAATYSSPRVAERGQRSPGRRRIAPKNSTCVNLSG